MIRKTLALGAAVVVGAGGSVAVDQLGAPLPGSSPSRTIYSFVYALKHHNYGRACSYYAPGNAKEMGGYAGCRAGFVASVAQATFFGSPEPYNDAFVVPGSEVVVSDDEVTYGLGFESAPDSTYTATIVRGKNGLWRIAGIE